MKRLQHILLLLLALTLATLAATQAYYLYKHKTENSGSLRITYRLVLSADCVMPGHDKLIDALHDMLSQKLPDLRHDQIHFSRVQRVFTIALPPISAGTNYFESLGQRLTKLITCATTLDPDMNDRHGFFLLEIKQIELNRSRPLDYISLLSMLVFSLYLIRLYFSKRP